VYINTSLYISKGHLSKVKAIQMKHDISKSKLISLLLLLYIEKNQAGKTFGKRVKYQKKIKDQYTTTAISLREDMYERWCDVRKVFKISASFAIAFSFENYLDEIIDEFNNDTKPFNYGSFYHVFSKTNDSAYTQIIQWGKPEETIMETILNLIDQ